MDRVTRALSNITGTSVNITLSIISSKTGPRLFYQNEIKPSNIKLIIHQVAFMPQEHTFAVTKKGTLKTEVRKAPVIYQSDIWSTLVLRVSI